MTAKSKGRFVWHELLTTDIAAAQKFYPQITGWTIQNWGEGANAYPMWVNGEAPLGGAMILPDQAKKMGAPPNWMAYISTPDTDATAKEVAKLGGKVLREPFDIPEIGRVAILADPQGAVFAAFTAAGDDMPHNAEPALGEFSWHELATTDYKAAFEFYSKIFGWKQIGDAPEVAPGMIYLMYGQGNEMYGGMFTISKDMPMPPAWLHYVRVPNADEAAKKTVQLGGKIANGPMDVPGGDRVAQLIDPQGAMFAVHSKAS
jgi:uncharacterized protein